MMRRRPESYKVPSGAKVVRLITGAFGKWAEVKVGPYVFRNIDGTVPAVPIVGGGLLSRFNLTFDYDRRWLQLTRRKARAKTR